MGGPGTVAGSMCHIRFFEGIQKTIPIAYSLYRYIQKVFFLGDQEKVDKICYLSPSCYSHRIKIKITGVIILPTQNHLKLPYICIG